MNELGKAATLFVTCMISTAFSGCLDNVFKNDEENEMFMEKVVL